MAFVGLAIIFENPWWWAVTIVVLVREWSVTLLRLFVLKKVVIAADTLGKLKTTFQVIGLSGLVLPLLDPDLPEWMETPAEVALLPGPGLPGGRRRAHRGLGRAVLPRGLAAAAPALRGEPAGGPVLVISDHVLRSWSAHLTGDESSQRVHPLSVPRA